MFEWGSSKKVNKYLQRGYLSVEKSYEEIKIGSYGGKWPDGNFIFFSDGNFRQVTF